MHRLPFSLPIILLIIVVSFDSLSAQVFSERKSRAGLTIGPGISAGASMILDSPQGQKIKPIVAWRGEASATYPLAEAINAGLVLGVDSRGTRAHHFDFDNIFTDTRITYFSLYPSFTFSGFNLGFNFGFPLSATAKSHTGAVVDVADDMVPTLLEARLGGVIPLAVDDAGWLSLTIMGGYSLSELVEVAGPSDIVGNWNHVALELGVRFEFLVPGTERSDAPVSE